MFGSKRAFARPGNYPLVDDYNSVLDVPALPREVKIEGDGGLLALSGERKLSVRSRGLSAIEYEVARVATAQINHLVSQTEGRFQSPEFQAPGRLQSGKHFAHRARASADRDGERLEGELFGVRFHPAPGQTSPTAAASAGSFS